MTPFTEHEALEALRALETKEVQALKSIIALHERIRTSIIYLENTDFDNVGMDAFIQGIAECDSDRTAYFEGEIYYYNVGRKFGQILKGLD